MPIRRGVMQAMCLLLIGIATLVADTGISALRAIANAVTVLDGGRLNGWEPREFSGRTIYAAEAVDGETVLAARAKASASGLYYTEGVDLETTPELRWRWRIEETLDNPDETTRSGDDFVARVYVITAHPIFFWRSRAICYVWASHVPTGTSWVNPYTEGIKMLALRSADDPVQRWATESRDVRADFMRLFGEAPSRIDAVAIMTDSDNTETLAAAWYDDIKWGAVAP